MTDRPVIGFLTDFGLDGAAAICRGVMLSIAPDAQIVDICHTVRKYAISDGAWLLASTVPWLPRGTHVAVVDPGVGTERRPVALRVGRGDVLIGPDNGLLLPAAEQLGGIEEARIIESRVATLATTSATFHGRDVFAPAAARLAMGLAFASVGPPIEAASLARLDLPRAEVERGRLATGVTYVDSFGNLRLAGGAADLVASVGPLEPGARLELELVDGHTSPALWGRTFGDVEPGELLVYVDSSGNVAIAESNGNAATRLGGAAGERIGIRRA